MDEHILDLYLEMILQGIRYRDLWVEHESCWKEFFK